MREIIKISADGEVTRHQYPADGSGYSAIHKYLTGLIGKDCQTVEHVRPIRLYENLDHEFDAYESDKAISMLCDEEFKLKHIRPKKNKVASWLYADDEDILGNVLIVGEMVDDEGIDFCPINEEIIDLVESQMKYLSNVL